MPISSPFIGTASPFKNALSYGEPNTTSPKNLFKMNEVGAWYDISDMSTLLKSQTEMATYGDPINMLLDKSKDLALGPELGSANLTTDMLAASPYYTYTDLGDRIRITRNNVPFTTGNAFTWFETSASLPAMTPFQLQFTTLNTSAEPVQGFFAVSRSGAEGIVGNQYNNGYKQFLFKLFPVNTGTIRVRFSPSRLSMPQNSLEGDWIEISKFLSIRPILGNHAYQTTVLRRPTLGREPINGRRNLLLYTELLSNAIWSKSANITSTSVANNFWSINKSTTDIGQTAQLITGTTVNTTYTLTIQLLAGTKNKLSMGLYAGDWGLSADSSSQVISGPAIITSSSNSLIAIENLSTTQISTIRISRTTRSTDTQQGQMNLIIYPITHSSQNQDTGSVLVRYPQLERNATPTTYQKVNSMYDITETGIDSINYLYFDGGDALITKTFPDPSTNKMQLFIGHKNTATFPAATTVIMSEYGVNNGSLGSYNLTIPASTTNYNFTSRGLNNVATTSVLSGSAFFNKKEIQTMVASQSSPATIKMRINNVDGSVVSTEKTGNFAAFPLTLSSRGGTEYYYNGYIYEYILRFGPLISDSTLRDYEGYINDKIKAF